MIKDFHKSPAPYAITAFAGAFLLFLVQPMIAKAITPQFGGTASVWTSALLVGQILLLAGSFYAQQLVRVNTWAIPRNINLAVALLASGLMALLPLYALERPLPSWARGISPELGVPLLMLASVGPAMILLGSLSPILQRSWSRVSQDANPYPLYAASNAGSLLGLLAFPLALEPTLGTALQLETWKWCAIGVIIVSAILVRAGPSLDSHAISEDGFVGQTSTFEQRRDWFLKAMTAVIIMMSAGQAIIADVMAMPLTWILPLGAFLIGYMTAFSPSETTDFKRSLKIPQAGVLLLAAAAANPLFLASPLVAVLAVAAIGLITHGLMRSVYEERPHVNDLGSFYMILALGGAAGGIVSAVLAPLLLDWRWELPLAILAAAYLLVPSVPLLRGQGMIKKVHVVMIVLAIVAGGLSFVLQLAGISKAEQFTGILLVILGTAIQSTHKRTSFAFWTFWLMLSMGLITQVLHSAEGESRRSYYGIMSVEHKGYQGRPALTLTHGTTVHGLQMQDKPADPTTYYTSTSGVGDAMKSLARQEKATVFVAGLGAGTLACLAPPSANLTFYEIDPQIVDAARNDFSFLSRCAPEAEIEVGDARMLLQKSSTPADMIILDAFSSDAIPMHLVTSEALQSYIKRLKPNGWLLIHTSNRYLDVSAPISAWAIRNGYQPMVLRDKTTKEDTKSESIWLAIRPDGWKRAEKNWAADSRWKRSYGAQEWTDDRSSILRIVKTM